jgi:hypothetical protein
VDDWLAAHPDHPAIPHVEDGPADAVDEDQARSNAAVDATDPGSILGAGSSEADGDEHRHDHDHNDERVAADEPATAG